MPSPLGRVPPKGAGEVCPKGAGEVCPKGTVFPLLEEKHLFRHGLRRATFPKGEGIAPAALTPLNNHCGYRF